MSLPDGLVWLASFPKSGNTWMRILLSNMLAGGVAPEDINDLTLSTPILSGRLAFESETLVDSRLLTDAEIERLRPSVHDMDARELEGAGFAKTHDAFTRLPDGTPLLGQSARAAIYLVRDPRDVAVSLAYHLNEPLDVALQVLNRPDSFFPGSFPGGPAKQMRQNLNGWTGHVQSWLDHCPAPLLLVRYEDLLADTLGELCRTLDFLKADYDTAEAKRAVRHAQFSELQRQELSKGFSERLGDQSQFFRQGQAGDWKARLTPAQCREIEQAHGPTMERLGYALSNQGISG